MKTITLVLLWLILTHLLYNMKVYSGGGLLNRVINKLPFEMHQPGGYQFCGPGTRLEQRLSRGDEGINELDRACKEHDIFYAKEKNVSKRHLADTILGSKAMKRYCSKDSTFSEKLAALAVAGAMKAKVKLGMGLKKNAGAMSSTINTNRNYNRILKKCIVKLERLWKTLQNCIEDLKTTTKTRLVVSHLHTTAKKNQKKKKEKCKLNNNNNNNNNNDKKKNNKTELRRRGNNIVDSDDNDEANDNIKQLKDSVQLNKPINLSTDTKIEDRRQEQGQKQLPQRKRKRDITIDIDHDITPDLKKYRVEEIGATATKPSARKRKLEDGEDGHRIPNKIKIINTDDVI